MMEYFKKVVQKYKTLLLYGFFGVGTSIFNILSYQLLLFVFNYKISNLIAIIATKILAYIANKLFVFKSHSENTWELVKEIAKYIVTRGLTGVIDFLGVILMVEMLHMDEVISKYILTVIVVVTNYFFGKFIVFRK